MTIYTKPFNLVCVAHPDDETLFFGGLIARERKRPWIVVCASDANADGMGAKRRAQFGRACRALGVLETHWLGLPDRYEVRLDQMELQNKLAPFSTAHEIYTHGPLGEYGHPHHQDMSFAVHSVFKKHSKVYSLAYNAFPEKRVHLDADAFELKARLLTQIYGSETIRFLNLLPATSTEGYVRVSFTEVETLYRYFIGIDKKLKTRNLKHYRWLVPYLKLKREIARPF